MTSWCICAIYGTRHVQSIWTFFLGVFLFRIGKKISFSLQGKILPRVFFFSSFFCVDWKKITQIWNFLNQLTFKNFQVQIWKFKLIFETFNFDLKIFNWDLKTLISYLKTFKSRFETLNIDFWKPLARIWKFSNQNLKLSTRIRKLSTPNQN